jgi:hypothetical protein
MEEQPNYTYEIEYKGDVIAEAKMLSSLENEAWLKEKTALRQQYRAITLSVTKWAFVDEAGKDLPIDIHSLDKIIAPEYVLTMSKAVFDKINEWRENREAVLKN